MAFRFYSTPAVTPILQKSLHWQRKENLLSATSETIEIAMAAGEYESFLKEMMECVNSSAQRRKISYGRMEHLLNYATQEQIEKIVIPKFMPSLDKDYDDIGHDLFEAIPIIFNKVSEDFLEKILPKLLKFLGQENTSSDPREKLFLICIEKMNANVVKKIIVPELFQLCEKSQQDTLLINCILEKLLPKCIEKMEAAELETEIVPKLLKLYKLGERDFFVSILLLKCVEKMSMNAIRRSLQPDLQSPFSNPKSSIHRDIAFVPYLALMSRFTKEENDKISEKLLKHLFIDLGERTADHILTFSKELRRKNRYVNEVFFQAVQKIVYDINEKRLKTHNYSQLFVSHMTAVQVANFVKQEHLENKLKIDTFFGQKLDLTPFEKFAALPMEIYPMELRMKSLKFLQAHLDDAGALFSATQCLKTDVFLGIEFRKILIELVQHVLKNIEAICAVDQQRSKSFENRLYGGAKITMEEFKTDHKIDKSHYCNALESCASIMTDEELMIHILPKTRQMLKVRDNGEIHIDSIDTDLIKSIKDCLKQVFSRIQNEDICREFFNYFFILYIKKGECSDLMPILSERVDSNTLSSAYRKVLHHSDHSNYTTLDRHAYLLALFSKRSSNRANESHHAETKEAKERPVTKKPGRLCAVM